MLTNCHGFTRYGNTEHRKVEAPLHIIDRAISYVSCRVVLVNHLVLNSSWRQDMYANSTGLIWTQRLLRSRTSHIKLFKDMNGGSAGHEAGSSTKNNSITSKMNRRLRISPTNTKTKTEGLTSESVTIELKILSNICVYEWYGGHQKTPEWRSRSRSQATILTVSMLKR